MRRWFLIFQAAFFERNIKIDILIFSMKTLTNSKDLTKKLHQISISASLSATGPNF